jgi:hypothetical protein
VTAPASSKAAELGLAIDDEELLAEWGPPLHAHVLDHPRLSQLTVFCSAKQAIASRIDCAAKHVSVFSFSFSFRFCVCVVRSNIARVRRA